MGGWFCLKPMERTSRKVARHTGGSIRCRTPVARQLRHRLQAARETGCISEVHYLRRHDEKTSENGDSKSDGYDRLQYVQFAPRLIYWKSGGPTVSQTITLKVSGKLLGVRVLDPGPDRVVINVPTTVHKQTYSIPITIGNTLLPQVTRLIASAVGPDGRIIEATAYALVLDDSVSTVSKRAINIEQPK